MLSTLENTTLGCKYTIARTYSSQFVVEIHSSVRIDTQSHRAAKSFHIPGIGAKLPVPHRCRMR